MAGLLHRVMRPDEVALSRGAAEGLLQFGFTDADRDRHALLAERANEGVLSAEEEAEYDDLLFLNQFFGILQAKARLTLDAAASGSAADDRG